MPNNNYYKNLPKKQMAAGVIFFNNKKEILIVKPNYRDDGWLIPGGVIEADESPLEATKREIKEEIGLEVNVGKLLCVDYYHPKGEKLESLKFLFDGGVLSAEQIANIKLQQEELTEYKFVKLDEALKLLINNLKKRVPLGLEALKNERCYYLEEGEAH